MYLYLIPYIENIVCACVCVKSENMLVRTCGCVHMCMVCVLVYVRHVRGRGIEMRKEVGDKEIVATKQLKFLGRIFGKDGLVNSALTGRIKDNH